MIKRILGLSKRDLLAALWWQVVDRRDRMALTRDLVYFLPSELREEDDDGLFYCRYDLLHEESYLWADKMIATSKGKVFDQEAALREIAIRKYWEIKGEEK